MATEASATEDPDLGAAFHNECVQIQAQLSSRKEAALEGVERWETTLGEIRNRLTARQNAARDAFAACHARYLELLQNYAGVPAERSALPITFNTADPAGSWAELSSKVSSLLGAGLDRISIRAGQYQVALRQLLTSGELQFVDDPRAHEAMCRTLIEELSATSKWASTLSRCASDRETVDDVEDRFVTLLKDFQALLEQVEREFRDSEKALVAVRLRQLDDQEQRVFDRILQLASASGLLDIGMLLEDEAIRRASAPGDAWGLLAQLYRKRRVSVQVGVHSPSEHP
jgi:hypothetical protein